MGFGTALTWVCVQVVIAIFAATTHAASVEPLFSEIAKLSGGARQTDQVSKAMEKIMKEMLVR
ncbi:MAG: hypothetical protein FJ145_13270 [Deltaproteobacteria bacterium]|nr:hypothetical protein [Deltaproteobacteria bacterium]